VAAALGEGEVSLHWLTIHHLDAGKSEVGGALANIGISHEGST
jgi:hypothetical protein